MNISNLAGCTVHNLIPVHYMPFLYSPLRHCNRPLMHFMFVLFHNEFCSGYGKEGKITHIQKELVFE